MRHNRDGKRFNRSSEHLKAMMANMTNDLIRYGKLRTTTPKAKELRRFAERMITLGKKGTLPARRRAMAFLRSKTSVTKLFAEVAPRFTDRSGGYTRVLKLGPRPGDNAPMAMIELVEGEPVKKTEPKKKKAPAKKKAAPKKTTKKAEGEKKTTAKKSTVKKSTTKKAAPKKKATANKAEGEKKSATSKSAFAKSTEKKATARKTTAKKTTKKSDDSK